jgi:hypothetical protein
VLGLVYKVINTFLSAGLIVGINSKENPFCCAWGGSFFKTDYGEFS